MGSEGDAAPTTATPWGVWVAVLGAVMTALVATAIIDRPPATSVGIGAEQYLPPDGSAWLLNADGREYLIESAWDTGVRFALQTPGAAGESLMSEIDARGVELLSAQFWRRTVTDLSGETPQLVQTFHRSRAGVALLTSTGGNQGFAFRPALTFLPAYPDTGMSWTQAGDALPLDFLGYTAATQITGRTDDCLELSDALRYLDPATDEVRYESMSSSTVCAGVGPVSSEGIEGGAASTQTFTAFGGRALPGATESAPPDWTNTAAWGTSTVELWVEDPTFGEWPALDVPHSDVDVTTSGVAVLGYGTDAIGYRVDGDRAVRTWIAHPGGSIVDVTTIGDVVLLSTSRRELVAYDAAGARGWTVQVPDAIRAAPVSDGAGGAVAVSLDGTVIRVDLATGRELWRITAGVGSVVAPVVAGDTVYLADRDDNVLAVELSSGQLRWSVPLLASAQFLLADASAALVGVGNGTVLRLAESDGAEEGRLIVPGVPRSAALLGPSSLVVQSDASLTGYGADGQQVFDIPGLTQGLASDGELALAMAPDGTVRLLDATGREHATFHADTAEIGVGYALVGLPDRAWVIGSNSTVTEIGER